MANKSWRFGDEELIYVKEVLNSGFGASTEGTMNQRLEKAFAKRFGVNYAITHSNGTATMHSCLVAAGVGPGDEVIIPALTVISNAFVTLHQNAVPVFADIDPHTLNMDPADVERKITPRTKAIIPVGLYGLPCDMDPIMALAKKHSLYVIEDNAQCYLGMYKGRLAGTIGHMASFSFENSKHITTGDGGIVITNEEALAKKIRKNSCLGFSMIEADNGRVRACKDDFQRPEFKRHDMFGWQYRLPEVAAAVGLAQVERMDTYVTKRQQMAKLFEEAVGDCDYLIPQATPEGYVHSYWTYTAIYEGENKIGVPWADFRKKYNEMGGNGVYAAWLVTYLEPVMAEMAFYGKGCPVRCPIYEGPKVEWGPGLCPVAESLQPKLMQFPLNYGTIEDAKLYADALKRTIEYFGKR
ncbi:MAG: DegT/DnrJ/EryC1/StrS family aminotransferase [Armatimonadota bacterium]